MLTQILTGFDPADLLIIPEAKRKWCKLDLPSPQVDRCLKPIFNPNWKLQMDDLELKTWRKGNRFFSLFFDGASKGNLGHAGGDGFLINPNEDEEIKYAWGLGVSKNNEAKFLALFQGLRLARE